MRGQDEDLPAPLKQDSERQSSPVISSRDSNTLSCSGCMGAVLEARSLEGGLGEGQEGGG